MNDTSKGIDSNKASIMLFQNMKLTFADLKKRKNHDRDLFNRLSPEGLFKIEAENPIYGEKVVMERRRYRLKHVISGRYLKLGTSDSLSLGSELDESTLFSFCPLH